MRFADELRGSEGEPCTVTDLRNGTVHVGTIEEVALGGRSVRVRYGLEDHDAGKLVSMDYSFVTLTNPETV